VSVLDYCTGYLAAFGVMVALSRRARDGGSYLVRVSLAQTARWVNALGRVPAEHVAAAGTLQLAVLLMPLTSTTEDAGTLRGVMTLLGPATVLVGASHQAVVTIMQREMSYGARRLLGQRTSLILILLLIVASAPTFLLSDNVGERLLGPTWSTARPLLLIAVLQKVGVALASGPLFVLRTSGLPAEVSLRLRLGITGMTLGGVVVGSQLDGARGSLIALAAGSICAGVAWQMLLIETGRRQTEAGSP